MNSPPPEDSSKPTQRRGGIRSRLSLFIRVLIGGGLLIVIFRSIALEEVAAAFASTDLILAIAVCFAAFADRLLMAYKWNVLLRSRDVVISLWQAIKILLVGNLLGTLTPGHIGGDAYRVAALTRLKKSQVVISTVLLERFIGLAIISMFAAVGAFVAPRFVSMGSSSLAWAISAGAIVVTATTVISLRKDFVQGMVRRIPFVAGSWMQSTLSDLYHAYADSHEHPRALFAFTVLTAAEVVMVVLMHFLAARSMNVDVSFAYLLCVVPLVVLLVRMPISIHGFGVFEGSLAYVLVLKGFSAADGVSIALLIRVVEVIAVLVPAAVIIWTNPMQVDTSPR